MTTLMAVHLRLLYTLPFLASPVASFFSIGNILVVDHLNINHEKGRHDIVKEFYFNLLRLGSDPRKEENIEKGKGTF